MVITWQKIAKMSNVNFLVFSLINMSTQRLELLSRSKTLVAVYLSKMHRLKILLMQQGREGCYY